MSCLSRVAFYKCRVVVVTLARNRIFGGTCASYVSFAPILVHHTSRCITYFSGKVMFIVVVPVYNALRQPELATASIITLRSFGPMSANSLLNHPSV